MSWSGYLADFHQHHPGVTEAVLKRAHDRDRTPYQWLLDALPAEGSVLDLACGSAPLWPALQGRRYIGVDTSPAELALARARGAGQLRLADATALPLASGSMDTVACAMAVQIITPLPAALGEISRVLAPGGLLVALVPTHSPLRAADAVWVTGLLGTLGRTIGYPNDTALRARTLPLLLGAAGLRLADDRKRRFAYPLRTPADADLLLSSLYLPGISPARLRAARRWLHALAAAHVALPVPLRRIAAVKAR
ncbi:class I SAM-dependent methyltransferase [Streptomyces sp. H10-C2]|uniref:class I SAM-dependent methyltransferase n=1 Tax=unclassified Streptomyces TaxID=2593676 RepID=UPI0024BAF389|nr:MULTISPECIES: class I SAM-dependent methyltransferase [unclassified Streptomyces]MDJ0346600.1 class I SAM-dependent methyltransferase [Streptomyces sp. PH10-H1]MDJ0375027.1 class I SAM-dependent methyltransferase [Streptomyces sp. H10-C2]